MSSASSEPPVNGDDSMTDDPGSRTDGGVQSLDASALLDRIVELERANQRLREQNERLERKAERLACDLDHRRLAHGYTIDDYERRLETANRELAEQDAGAETRPGRLVDAVVGRLTAVRNSSEDPSLL
ncbi:hypothetical protein [Halobellus inordinatus]|uniref:hypothetical protein n=1 Tax=Halobellus inordinatus TaxID=1126236 RepID=UPI0021148C81|nr:hypothetical protein [Halobellus ramosii]